MAGDGSKKNLQPERHFPLNFSRIRHLVIVTFSQLLACFNLLNQLHSSYLIGITEIQNYRNDSSLARRLLFYFKDLFIIKEM